MSDTHPHPAGPGPACAQDLHVHTVFSRMDGAVVPEQTVALVGWMGHARVAGISDHLEAVHKEFPAYAAEVRRHGLKLGVEVNGASWVSTARRLPVDYFVYHCRDTTADYRGAATLLDVGRPVIVAHPMALGTDLARVPAGCLIEINNRYVWRDDWQRKLAPFRRRFSFVLGSDAHQPHWLNQNVARRVAAALGVAETLLFDP